MMAPGKNRTLSAGRGLRDPLLLTPILMLLTLTAYLPALRGGFVWDDDAYVTANLTLRDRHGLQRIWVEPRSTPQYYPLVHTTFWVEYQLWQLRPLGYHLTNVFLHGVAAVLLWRLLLRLHVPGAWLAAAAFAIHPVHVESVAWITERKNVLSGVFYLAAALAFIRFDPIDAEVSKHRARWYLLALLLFLAALLSKSVTATLPAALLVLLLWKRGAAPKRSLLLLAPMFILGIAAGWTTVWLEQRHVGAMGEEWSFSLLDRLLIAGRAVWFYAYKLLAPVNLVFIYPRWNIDDRMLWQYAFPLSALLLLVSLWMLRKRIGAGPVVAALLFGGTLFPALGFFNVYPMRYSFVADHFQYLASIPLIALGAAAWSRLEKRKRGPVAAISAVAILLALGAQTWRHSLKYRDAESLWRHTIASNPTAWMAHNNLAVLLDEEQGRLDEAMNHYVRTAELRPDWESFHNLSSAHARRGDLDQALGAYRQAMALAPQHPHVAHVLGGLAYGLANRLAADGRIHDAVAAYRDSLELRPDRIEALNNLAWILATHPAVHDQSPELAINLGRRAAELTSESEPAILDTLAAAYANAGRFAEAQRISERAAALAVLRAERDLAAMIEAHRQLFAAHMPVRESKMDFVPADLEVGAPLER